MKTNNILTRIEYIYLTVKERWTSNSPAFFKGLKNFALQLGGAALAVIAINATLPISLPTSVITIASYIVAVCSAVAGTAKLTKE